MTQTIRIASGPWRDSDQTRAYVQLTSTRGGSRNGDGCVAAAPAPARRARTQPGPQAAESEGPLRRGGRRRPARFSELCGSDRGRCAPAPATRALLSALLRVGPLRAATGHIGRRLRLRGRREPARGTPPAPCPCCLLPPGLVHRADALQAT